MLHDLCTAAVAEALSQGLPAARAQGSRMTTAVVKQQAGPTGGCGGGQCQATKQHNWSLLRVFELCMSLLYAQKGDVYHCAAEDAKP